ncbi:hypothetical protein [Enterococcus faecalis]|uniref:hypothetical protein n=1 Tax=Enterococcus faecalis TaxID=1351 RepID=UPI00115E5DED|nr:hypothetical protein [Enterococcus faecalis]EIQ7101470.1 hypothetical protein [Enterococcus faecalis]MUO53270.1 hypothetical protein [Enterococcus faecalis]
MTNNKTILNLFLVLLKIIFAIAMAAVEVWVIQQLWNKIISVVFDIATISYLETLGVGLIISYFGHSEKEEDDYRFLIKHGLFILCGLIVIVFV